jgi:hypothetical protein
MHDLDRTRLEFEQLGEGEYAQEAWPQETEAWPQEQEAWPQETEAGWQAGETGEEFEGEEERGPLDEVEEMELAAGLLEVSSQEELERFLGGLIRRAGAAAGQFLRSDTARALGGILRNAARQALPVVGRGLGQWAAPGGDGGAGARLAQQAGRFFGLELEGLSAEDREFEVARQFVRLAGEATQQAALVPPSTPPDAAARAAVTAAARRYAPGLAARIDRYPSGPYGQRRSGRWVRRGRNILVIGI